MLAGDVGRGAAGKDRRLVLAFTMSPMANAAEDSGTSVIRSTPWLSSQSPAIDDRDIRLQLQIGGNQFDLHIRMEFGEVLDGELRAVHRPLAGIGRVNADHVGQHADADRLRLRPQDEAGRRRPGRRQSVRDAEWIGS